MQGDHADSPDTLVVLPAPKVALDQTIWGPVSCTMFYLIMSTLEGHTAAESVEKLQSSFWSTYLSGGAVFLPTAMLTYSVIPPQHRGLFLQGVGLGTYLVSSIETETGRT